MSHNKAFIADNAHIWQVSADKIMAELNRYPTDVQLEILRLLQSKMQEEIVKRTNDYHKMIQTINGLKTPMHPI